MSGGAHLVIGERGRRNARAAASVAVLALALAAPAAEAASAPDRGRPFDPQPRSEPRFAVAPPEANPQRQRHIVGAADGTGLFLEAWLPAPKDGQVPPERMPVVLHYSPYLRKGEVERPIDVGTDPLKELVPRGYAYVQAHVRGTSSSGGCIEQTAEHEGDDGARIVEWLGREAPWSDGNVGMTGLSYAGATQVATATADDSVRLEHLKAVVIAGGVASAYDFFHHDGVAHTLLAPGASLVFFGRDSLLRTVDDTNSAALPERAGCQPSVLLGTARLSGDYTDFHAARDHTRHLARWQVPLLLSHGHADRRVTANQIPGFFDGLPAGVPRAGIFGWYDHEWPDDMSFNGEGLDSPRKDWERADIGSGAVIAWFDHWLKGLDTGAGAWPVAQVQGSDGQWRSEHDWPATGGPVGRLALGAGGTLGAAAPSGSTSYREGAFEIDVDGARQLPGTAAVFETPPLSGRLEVTGQPVLDLWVVLDRPDAHVAAKLEALDPAGRRVIPEAFAVGLRSAQHRGDLEDGRFRQRSGAPAPVGTPLRLRIRFDPTDLVVPAGGRLRLTLSGSTIVFDGLDAVEQGLGVLVQGPSLPSGSATGVTVLHDCTHASVLSFAMPAEDSELLDVREKDQIGEPLGAEPDSAPLPADGDGIATRSPCGGQPDRRPPAALAPKARLTPAGRRAAWRAEPRSPSRERPRDVDVLRP